MADRADLGKLNLAAPFAEEISKNLRELISTSIAVNSSYTSNVILSKSGGLPEQRGNKTECALLGFTPALGFDYRAIRERHQEDSFEKVYTFNSSRKSMSTVIKIPGGWRVFCKGAAEIVLAK